LKKSEKFKDLRQLILDHVWVPFIPWNELTAPGGLKIFVETEGCHATDIEGNTYLDSFSSIMYNQIGYGRKEIADAAYEQMRKMSSSMLHYANLPQIKLAAKLAEITPGTLSRVFFANGGGEANEAAVKMAKKYQLNLGFRNRHKVIGRFYSFHGTTYGNMSIGWRPGKMWEDFLPGVPGVRHVGYPYCFRCPYGLEYPNCGLQCAKAVERAIQIEGPESVAAVIMEPMSISTGAAVPPQEYYPLVRSICDKYGVLLIIDEVVTAFGRTGKMFGMESFGVVPDIMVMGKGLTSGYLPVSAAIATREVAKTFEGGLKEMLVHSTTFSGHPVGCAVALANIDIIEKEKLVENSAAMGKYLFEKLNVLYDHPSVGDIRGLGLMCGIELVKDKKTKEPLTPKDNLNKRVEAKFIKEGILPGQAFITTMSIMPALIITEDEIDKIVAVTDKAIGEIEKELSIS